MIRKIHVLDANYSGLEEKFSSGLELDTDSNIVLMVGPNGSGKTALMRMLATSLTNRAFFEKHGFSERKYAYDIEYISGRYAPLWGQSGKAEIDGLEATLQSASPNDDGLYPLHQDRIKLLEKLKQRDGFPDITPIIKESNTERYQEWSRQVTEAGFSPDELWEKRDKLYSRLVSRNLRLEDVTERPALPEDKWHYSEARRKQDINLGELVSSLKHGDMPLITRTQTHYFIDEESHEALMEYFAQFSVPTDANIWGYVRAEMDEKPITMYTALILPSDPNQGRGARDDMPYTHFREDMKKRVEKSPGLALRENVDALFEEIELHFQGKEKRYQTAEERKEKYVSEKIVANLPEELRGSQLLVFSDEPTVFLDLKNKIHYRDRLLEMSKKYGTDIQFFIPTNDIALVDGCRGNCRYINLYETPTVSTAELSLEM